MDEKEIREAVKYFKDELEFWEKNAGREQMLAMNRLLSLAERWLAVKMPEKKECGLHKDAIDGPADVLTCMSCAAIEIHNLMIDDFRTLIAKDYISRAEHERQIAELKGRVLSVEEIRSISAQAYCTDRNSKKVLDPDLLEDIAQAIHDEMAKGEK